jgi:class 3 adenylate cyclase
LVPADGVNIAARLEEIAKPGTICLSEDAYRQASGRRAAGEMRSSIGATQLKNIDRPIRAYIRCRWGPCKAEARDECEPFRTVTKSGFFVFSQLRLGPLL